jgi:hypothetical protein
MSKIAIGMRQHGPGIAIELLVNVGLPFLIYDKTAAALGDTRALMASAIPPVLWSLLEFARKRRVDAMSLMVLLGVGLSILAVLGGGSARFLQLRENLVTAVVGLVFLGSAMIGRPLIYELAKAGEARKSAAEAEEFAAKRDLPGFRRTMMLMTLVWGFGLLASAAATCALVFLLSIRTYLIVGPLVGYGMIGALILWTFWYRARVRSRARP